MDTDTAGKIISLPPAATWTRDDDLDAISDLWPVDDDPDALLRFILAQRHGDSGEA